MDFKALLKKPSFSQPFLIKAVIIFIFTSTIFSFLYYGYQQFSETKNRLSSSLASRANLEKQLEEIKEELEFLKSQDQYLINQELKKEIDQIQNTYQKAVQSYERLLDLKGLTQETADLDALFALSLNLLSERNYASSSAALANLQKQIQQESEAITAALQEKQAVADLPQTNQPPASGYRRQIVKTPVGSFNVSIITADLNSTRVIVDTASSSDCRNDCPTLPLADYVARNAAFAGINGSYFCPAEYPSCADKKNSFDTLLMNKDKVYFNSENNVYSTVPATIFKDNWARFVTRSLEWGRDTSVDAVIANQPLLTLNGNLYFTGDAEPKRASKGGRSFIGTTGSTVYLGVVHNATVAEAAQVVHTLGINSVLNLDNGGSTALWYSGYKVGPGRNLANVVLLIKK